MVSSKCRLVPLPEAPAPASDTRVFGLNFALSLRDRCWQAEMASPETHSKLGRARIKTQDFATLQGGAGLIHNRLRSLMRCV